MTAPTVSVILPVYNGEQYLRCAIDSVLEQTFQDFELIVVDDGSTDSTPDIARSYGARLRFVRQDNTGVSGAFNHGLSLATGQYICWLSHDDRFLQTKIEKQVSALSKIAAPAVCYTDVQMINEEGIALSDCRLPEYDQTQALRHVATGGLICTASYSVMYDRRCIEVVGMYSVKLRYAQDAEMLTRFARHFPLIRVPEILMQVREHQDRESRSRNWAREVTRFFLEQLDDLALNELFPELGPGATREQRMTAYRWLADNLAVRPFPIYLAAIPQYRRALRESPARGTALLPRIARVYWYHFRQSLKHQQLTSMFRMMGSRKVNAGDV